MKKPAKVTNEKPKTITCNHCRYERPEKDERCHICGYPWAFAAGAGGKTGSKAKRP